MGYRNTVCHCVWRENRKSLNPCVNLYTNIILNLKHRSDFHSTTSVPSLSELKMVEGHMKNELNIMEVILNSDLKTVSEFQEWYINHPYCREIEELRQIGKNGRDGQNKAGGS
jgi:hypothetical protein